MPFPYIKEVVEVADVFPRDAHLVVDDEAGHLLPLPLLLKARLFLVEGEMLPGDDSAEFREEFAAFLVDVVHAAEGDVVGIAGIIEAEALGETAEPPVEVAADDVREDGGARRSLRRATLSGSSSGLTYVQHSPEMASAMVSLKLNGRVFSVPQTRDLEMLGKKSFKSVLKT